MPQGGAHAVTPEASVAGGSRGGVAHLMTFRRVRRVSRTDKDGALCSLASLART